MHDFLKAFCAKKVIFPKIITRFKSEANLKKKRFEHLKSAWDNAFERTRIFRNASIEASIRRSKPKQFWVRI